MTSMRGFLNIDKPAGMTSFDVVRWVRRAARTKRVGHGGTLDPAATGVLPVAVGEATRFVDELLGTGKRYRAEVLLGRETDTYDLDGEILAQRDASAITRVEIEGALAPFLGTIMQVPPAYSAIKRDGVPAYRAARRGEPLALAARPVAVYAVDILAVVLGVEARVTLDVACGSGFYVRSLAHDLGAALGVGGTLAALRRTRVGPFAIEEATPLDRACALLEAGATQHLLHAPDVVLTRLPAVIVGEYEEARVRRGLDLAVEARAGFSWPPEGPSGVLGGASGAAEDARRARCYGLAGELVAVLEARPGGSAAAA
ncbi:MAG: tRNA pseudouridine(55) synthase TruB, partial [Dehalococcoidia bacterium]|nr:tRNA pseudouridine(55) synthase TruB [Dehalococcoidia bacterium]